MSHFTVMVVGDDIEKQLTPFEEHSPEAYEVVPLTELSEAIGKLGYDGILHHISKSLKEKDPVAILSEEMLLDDNGKLSALMRDLRGSGIEEVLIADEKTGKLQALKRIVHNGKWDWFIVGGRWSGRLLIKPDSIPPKNAIKGGEEENNLRRKYSNIPALSEMRELDLPTNVYDALPKRLIDIETMEENYVKENQFIVDVYNVVSKYDFKTPNEIRLEMLDEGKKPTIAEVLRVADEQPAIKALDEAGLETKLDFDLDLLKVPPQHFDQVLRGRAWQPLAWLKDGEWVERGSMGWFGIVSDEEDYVVWDKRCREIWDSIPDDTMVTLVDCHI